LEPLITLVRDPDLKPEQKIRVLKAIAKVGGEKTLDVMTVGLKDPQVEVRVAAAEALGFFVTEGAIPHLIKATEDEDAKVRINAVKGLSGFPGDDRVAEAIGKRTDDPDEKVRRQSIDALGMLGRPSDAMIAILRKCESQKDPYVANKAGSILHHWGLK
jgi:HEAT repeat protein